MAEQVKLRIDPAGSGKPEFPELAGVCLGDIESGTVRRKPDTVRIFEREDDLLDLAAIGTRVEYADAVAFACTPAGRRITGAPLVMDQGWSAR